MANAGAIPVSATALAVLKKYGLYPLVANAATLGGDKIVISATRNGCDRTHVASPDPIRMVRLPVSGWLVLTVFVLRAEYRRFVWRITHKNGRKYEPDYCQQ